MIQKKLLNKVIQEFQVQEFIKSQLKQVGFSGAQLQLTPVGEKIIIFASRPGLIVGRKGQSIKKLTQMLKAKFNLENPQIEINEVQNVNLDPHIISERIANSLERFGAMRFKSIGHKAMEDVMNAGGLGVEVLISGKIPSARAKRWRFYQGYLKKSGDTVTKAVRKAYTTAELKTGTVGIQVRIMLPNVSLPDRITFTTLEEREEAKGVVASAVQKSSSEVIEKGSDETSTTASDAPKKERKKRSPKAKPASKDQESK